jgi:hypothetical protein
VLEESARAREQALEQACEQAWGQARDLAAAQMASEREGLASERDGLAREKQALIQAHDKRIAEIETELEWMRSSNDALCEDHVRVLESLHAENEEALQHERHAAEEKMAAARLELDSTRAELVAQWSDALSQVTARDHELAIRAQGSSQLEEEIAQYRERIKTVLAERNALTTALERERDENAHELERLKQEAAQRQAEHEKCLNEMADLRTQQTQKDNELLEQKILVARAQPEIRATVTEWESEHESDIARFVSDVQQSMGALRREFEASSKEQVAVA